MGSTTYQEFRTHFEGDHALTRRFQKLDINEPSRSDAIKILQGLKSRYEDYHQVKYSSGAIKAAVDLSSRYINDRKLPDKAIDVIDEVAAAVALKRKDTGSEPVEEKVISVDMVQSVVANGSCTGT